jgi:hydroxymethylpyrimidine pyrophosphatase-like HAD family hydrolase
MPTLHYRTGWSSAALHLSADGGLTWQTVPFSPARTSPIGPDFRVITLPVAAAGTRFVPTDPSASPAAWDNPAPACPAGLRADDSNAYFLPGTDREDDLYVLYSGVLSKHEHALRTPGLSIVTDIDGTLHGCDDSLAEFYEVWARRLALSGAHLVYNTGRCIDSVLELIATEAGRLPVPVAAVTRVGGYVHWFRDNHGRGEWAGEAPAEDLAWRRVRIDLPGWDETCIPAAREVLQGLMKEVEEGEEPHAKWLQDGVGEPECVQIAVWVKESAAGRFARVLKERLAARPVKLIVSGQGSHRYMDVTIASGGKLGGTRYVVERLPGPGSSVENVVFSGDSGNDIDALEGDLKGIIVGNVQDDLRAAHEERVGREAAPFEVRLVESGFARGIVQGLREHGFLVETL